METMTRMRPFSALSDADRTDVARVETSVPSQHALVEVRVAVRSADTGRAYTGSAATMRFGCAVAVCVTSVRLQLADFVLGAFVADTRICRHVGKAIKSD
jgi:hypothetical protein